MPEPVSVVQPDMNELHNSILSYVVNSSPEEVEDE